MERIIGALTFKRQVYADVEKDTSFTPTAWGIVAVVGLLSQLGSAASLAYGEGGQLDVTSWLLGGVVGAVVSVAGFALGAFLISWLGKSLFKADVTFDEMVRTLGLAQIWNLAGVVGVVGAFVPLLGCITAPIACIGAILGLVSWFIAAQEALDLDTGQTAITVIVGWLVSFFVTGLIGGVVLAAVGLAAGGGSLLMEQLRQIAP
ncbi:MAG: hypothetical protein KIS88_06270 [Anaerolineales bacterium]|nr:hypothetical protein [Anaerolineales bacterium]